METLSRLPFSSQLQSSHHPQLFGLWAPSPTSLPTLARMGRNKTSQPKSVILWIWGTQMFPEGAVWHLPTFWELFRWDRPLKWAGPERHKDIISIMQMSGNVPSLGMGRVAVLSSLSLFPPPQVRRHPRSLKCFNTVPSRLPFHICPLDCPEEKNPRGAQDFRGVLPHGLPHWAGPSSRREVILPAEKQKGLSLRPRLTPRQRRGGGRRRVCPRHRWAP